MRSVCLWGTCLKKIADEAQVEAVVKIFRTRLPDVRITMFSRDAEALVARHPGVDAIDTRDLPRIYRALAGADLFALIGGPFYEDPLQAVHCTILLGMARFHRVPTMSYGATLFRFGTWWGRPWFRALFRSLDAVAVRERVATDVLRDLGYAGEVSVFADPRFVLEPDPPQGVRDLLRAEGIDPGRPLVLVTTRHFDEHTPAWVLRSHSASPQRIEATKAALAGAIDAVGAEAEVVFLPMHPDYEDDVRDARAIQERLQSSTRTRILSRRYSVGETMGMIAQAELLLACRVGSAVFASVSGTPVLAIAHEHRLLDHMRRMDQDDCVFDWQTLDPGAYVTRVRRAWEERESQRGKVQARAQEMAQLAWDNTDVIRTLVRA